MMLAHFLRQIKMHSVRGASLRQLKHFTKWKNSFNPSSSSIRDEQPWLTFDAINLLKTLIKNDFIIFEYGGGGSTLFFLSHAAKVITVEHDEAWFKKLKQTVRAANKWTGNYIKADNGNLADTPDPSNPDHYTSADAASKGLNYRRYAECIDQFPENHFDAVLVDGRSRPSCIKHALPRIKHGGYLIVDNTDRDYYLSRFRDKLEKEFTPLISNSGATPYCMEFTQTSIWRKK